VDGINAEIQRIVEEMICNRPECNLLNHRDLRRAFQGWGIPAQAVFEATLGLEPARRFTARDLKHFFAGTMESQVYREVQVVVSGLAHFINHRGHRYASSRDCLAHWKHLTDPSKDTGNEIDVPCHITQWPGREWQAGRGFALTH
jgi:hypothetical protein